MSLLFVMALHFVQIPVHVQEIAQEVYQEYSSLHDKEIILRKKNLGKSTMRAMPRIKFRGIKPRIVYGLDIAEYVRDSDVQKVEDLHRDILKGWLAHEFGHLHDYVERSTLEMMFYGLRYILSSGFASKVEHRADEIAVQHGFYKYLKITKIYLFSREFTKTKYGVKLSKLYMSLEDLEICNRDWLLTLEGE